MTWWRHRLGEAGAEAMLKETIQTGEAINAILRAAAMNFPQLQGCFWPFWITRA